MWHTKENVQSYHRTFLKSLLHELDIVKYTIDFELHIIYSCAIMKTFLNETINRLNIFLIRIVNALTDSGRLLKQPFLTNIFTMWSSLIIKIPRISHTHTHTHTHTDTPQTHTTHTHHRRRHGNPTKCIIGNSQQL